MAKFLGAKVVSPDSWILPARAGEAATDKAEKPPAKKTRTTKAGRTTLQVIPNDGPIPAGIIASLKGERVEGPSAIEVVYIHSACTEVIPAKTFGCQKQGDFWVTIDSVAYKECAESRPEDMCIERWKATHTITVWRDPACTQQVRKIREAQMRCD